MTNDEAKVLRGVVEALSLLYKSPYVEVDDLKQEAWLAVLRAEKDYKPESGASLATFVKRPIHWALTNYVKGVKAEGENCISLDARVGGERSSSDSPSSLHEVVGTEPSQAFEFELNEAWEEASKRFPKETLEILVLRSEGFSFKEIGERIGKSEMATLMVYNRAASSKKNKKVA